MKELKSNKIQRHLSFLEVTFAKSLIDLFFWTMYVQKDNRTVIFEISLLASNDITIFTNLDSTADFLADMNCELIILHTQSSIMTPIVLISWLISWKNSRQISSKKYLANQLIKQLTKISALILHRKDLNTFQSIDNNKDEISIRFTLSMHEHYAKIRKISQDLIVLFRRTLEKENLGKYYSAQWSSSLGRGWKNCSDRFRKLSNGCVLAYAIRIKAYMPICAFFLNWPRDPLFSKFS